jgi:hypothetical protein
VDRQERLLASFVDDCWEPASALDVLWDFAGRPERSNAVACCLRVAGGDVDGGQVMAVHEQGAVTDTLVPGVAYLWSLWTGGAPTREEMLAVARERPWPPSA